MSMTPLGAKACLPHNFSTATCWISASAGSGKTRALIQRIFILMLSGCPAHHIVCLTFTQRAAKEMTERALKELEHWQHLCHMDDDAALFHHLSPLCPDLTCAASLKSRAQQALISFKEKPFSIHTFHSFCQHFLHGFLPKIAQKGQPMMAPAYGDILWKKSVQKTLEEAKDAPDSVKAYIISKVEEGQCMTRLLEATRQHYLSFSLAKSLGPMPKLGELPLTYKPSCAESDGQIYKDKKRKAHHRASLSALNSQALWLIERVIAHYNHMKQGFWDFDDVLIAMLKVLESPDFMGLASVELYHQWQHVLIDEAQDTSVVQWRILRHMTEILLSNPKKTFFVVGDPKQSIYSFQGASIEMFLGMKTFIKHWVQAHGGTFNAHQLHRSHRSGKAILSLMNEVFRGKTLGGQIFPHHVGSGRAKGQVMWWPPSKIFTSENPVPAQERRQDLIHFWCQQLLSWRQAPLFLESAKRAMTMADVLILLPRRGVFFRDMAKALRQEGLLWGGEADIETHEQVQVLWMVFRFIMNPGDDVALALIIESLAPIYQEHFANRDARDHGDGRDTIPKDFEGKDLKAGSGTDLAPDEDPDAADGHKNAGSSLSLSDGGPEDDGAVDTDGLGALPLLTLFSFARERGETLWCGVQCFPTLWQALCAREDLKKMLAPAPTSYWRNFGIWMGSVLGDFLAKANLCISVAHHQELDHELDHELPPGISCAVDACTHEGYGQEESFARQENAAVVYRAPETIVSGIGQLYSQVFLKNEAFSALFVRWGEKASGILEAFLQALQEDFLASLGGAHLRENSEEVEISRTLNPDSPLISPPFLPSFLPLPPSIVAQDQAMEEKGHYSNLWHHPYAPLFRMLCRWIQGYTFVLPFGQGVRFMTIHGAKGAESPVVIIPTLPSPLSHTEEALWGGDPEISASSELQDSEFWRLLYVALSRGKDVLCLSAEKEAKGWYGAIAGALCQAPEGDAGSSMSPSKEG